MTASTPQVQASSFTYGKFDPRHYDLFTRTWGGYVAKGTAKPLRLDQLKLLYEANPAGSSVVTTIEENGVWIGAISAIATNILRPDGGTTKGYQIGDFMVDPSYQGRGFGGKLLRELTRSLLGMRVAVYTFPNTRSVGVFLKQSYLELKWIPAVTYPLFLSQVADRMSSKSKVRDIPIDTACRLADELIRSSRPNAIIEKSGAYLRWRYALMRDAGDYTFTFVEPKGDGARSLLVWTLFRYRGIPVQVVVDVLSEGGAGPPLREIGPSGLRKGGWIGINNVEQRPGWKLPPFAVENPDALRSTARAASRPA